MNKNLAKGIMLLLAGVLGTLAVKHDLFGIDADAAGWLQMLSGSLLGGAFWKRPGD